MRCAVCFKYRVFVILLISLFGTACSLNEGGVGDRYSISCVIDLPLERVGAQVKAPVEDKALPVAQGTAVPGDEGLSPSNAKNIQQLARWGDGTVRRTFWFPDGERVAADTFHGVYIYDASDYRQIDFVSHGHEQTLVGITHDGTGFILVSPDQITLQRVNNGSIVTQFAYPRLSLLEVSHQSVRGVFDVREPGELHGRLEVKDLTNGRKLGDVVIDRSPLAAALNTNGDLIAVASEFQRVRIWQVSTGDLVQELNHDDSFIITSLAFDPNGELLATGSFNGSIKLWRLDDGELLREMSSSVFPVRSLLFSPEGEQLASSSGGYSKIRIWNPANGRELFAVRGAHLAFSPASTQLTTSGLTYDLQFRSGKDGANLHTVGEETSWLSSVAVSPDSELVAIGDSDGYLTIRRSSNGEILCRGKVTRANVTSIDFTPDSTRVATLGFDGDVRVWSLTDGQLVYSLPDRENRFIVKFSPDGALLATSMQDEWLRLWNAEDGTLVKQYPGHDDWGNSVAFTDDGQRVASAGVQGISIWNLETDEREATLPRSNHISALVYGADNELLAWDMSRGVRLWQLAEGREIYTTEDHTNVVEDVVFTPDSALIISLDANGLILIRRTEDGNVLSKFQAGAGVDDLALSPDGKRIYTVGMDGTVAVWGVVSEQ